MKWLDYRAKLGIGFDDDQKREAFRNNIASLFDGLRDYLFSQRMGYAPSFRPYYVMVGELPYNSQYNDIDALSYSVRSNETDSISTIISKCVALINALNRSHEEAYGSVIKESVVTYLDNLKIQYSIVTDEDGMFIFPKGVPEFDDALVSAPLDWLKDYPKAQKEWSIALRGYSEATPDNARHVADLFRKALETFFQEFFNTGDGRTLENIKADYGKYLKDNGVPAEVSNNFETLLQLYTNYMNKYAKHGPKAKINVLEYLMYQTGNIIRLVITLKQGEAV